MHFINGSVILNYYYRYPVGEFKLKKSQSEFKKCDKSIIYWWHYFYSTNAVLLLGKGLLRFYLKKKTIILLESAKEIPVYPVPPLN